MLLNPLQKARFNEKPEQDIATDLKPLPLETPLNTNKVYSFFLKLIRFSLKLLKIIYINILNLP